MIDFSELSNSCNNNEGIVHVGGELSTENLLNSYSCGFSHGLMIIYLYLVEPRPQNGVVPKKLNYQSL